MVDRDVLSTRLSALESYLAELRSFRRHSREEFIAEHLDIDHGRSYDAIENDLTSLEELARALAPLLEDSEE